MNQEPNGGAAGAVEHITAQPIERRADWTGQAGAASAGSLTPDRRAAVREAVATALGDAYDCTRHWSAWHMGTMTSADFMLVADQDARLDEIVDAVLGALPAPSAKQEPAAAYMHADGRVVPAATMDAARRDGGAMASSLRDYTIELVPRTAAPSASASPAVPETQHRESEPARPDILENLTYHAYERDDMTIEELLQTLSAEGYRKVRQRTHRQLELQLLSLLAGAAPVAGSQQVPEAQIVKAGRALADRHAEVCNVDKEDNWKLYGNDFIEEARFVIEAIAAAAPAVPVPVEHGWISVDDELPKFPRSVLVARHSDADGEPCLDPGVAMLYPDGRWRGIGVFYAMGKQPPYEMRETAMEVTHWMPLPAAPSLQQGKEGAAS